MTRQPAVQIIERGDIGDEQWKAVGETDMVAGAAEVGIDRARRSRIAHMHEAA